MFQKTMMILTKIWPYEYLSDSFCTKGEVILLEKTQWHLDGLQNPRTTVRQQDITFINSLITSAVLEAIAVTF